MTQADYIASMQAHTAGGERMVPELWPGDEGVILSHFRHWRKVAGLLRSGVKTLDVGCGCGMSSRIYSLATAAPVAAMDRMDVVRVSFRNYSTPGVQFIAHDLRDPFTLPNWAPFGNVVCVDVLEHLPQDIMPVVLRSMATVGASDCQYLLSVPIKPDGTDKCSWHLRIWKSVDEFMDETCQILPRSRVTFI